jgi:hypothetical protein
VIYQYGGALHLKYSGDPASLTIYNLEQLNAGVYFLKVTTAGRSFTRKMFVAN